MHPPNIGPANTRRRREIRPLWGGYRCASAPAQRYRVAQRAGLIKYLAPVARWA